MSKKITNVTIWAREVFEDNDYMTCIKIIEEARASKMLTNGDYKIANRVISDMVEAYRESVRQSMAH